MKDLRNFCCSFMVLLTFPFCLPAQASLQLTHCNELSASLSLQEFTQQPPSDTYTFILEKALLPDVWQKYKSQKSTNLFADFHGLLEGWYRVTIVPTQQNNQPFTEIHYAQQTETKQAAHTFVSPPIRINRLSMECMTTKQVHRKRSQFLPKGLLLFPNPAKDHFEVQLPKGNTNADFILFDSLGQIVKKGNISSIHPFISVTNFYPGTYFIQVSLQNQVLARQKLVVVH
ncbi:MAG: T9SS type A sorting domain-containing protein [Bacteroidota bacterium]